jgi:hypothetical protein
MIDYIKILKIILNEIKNTIKLYTAELDNNKFEPTEEHELKKPMFIHKILYNVGLVATFMPLFIIFSYWVVTDDAISNIIHNRTLILFGIPFNITIICCTTIIGIILFLTDLKIYTKTHNIICKMTAQHDKFIYESKKNIKINKTKELLKNFTGEEIDDNEIDALINYNYYGSSNIPVKGNLYEIPIKTMINKANVKNTNKFQGIIGNGKVSNTKAIIIALLKTDSNIPNITTPDEYQNTLINVFDTSNLIQNKNN